MRETFLIQQKRSHKMFLQTLSMLPKKLQRSRRRKERRRKCSSTKEERRGVTRCPSRPCRCSRRSSGGQEERRRKCSSTKKKEERRNHKMIHLPVPEKFPSRLEEAPREEMSSYASSEELSVHIKSLDKKIHRPVSGA